MTTYTLSQIAIAVGSLFGITTTLLGSQFYHTFVVFPPQITSWLAVLTTYFLFQIAIAVGSLFGITTTLLGSVFSLPRAVYAMSADGLFFRCFAYINAWTQTPVLAILVFGSVAGVLTLLVDMETLVEFLSIGTLSSFTIVAAGVLVLRYQPVIDCQFELKPEESGEFDADRKQLITSSQSHHDIGKLKSHFTSVPVLRHVEGPWLPTAAIVAGIISMALFSILLVLVS